MGNKKARYVFISGIPTAGKSYLAEKLAREIGVQHIDVDNWRHEMTQDAELKKWADFFWNQNEKEYWNNNNCDQQWENLKNQSEAFWPTILKNIKKVQKEERGALFEGVNILPHLAHRDLDFVGIVLLGESFEKILERNKENPRWGNTEELQIKEAQAFWNCERPRYEQEAKRYGFKVFIDQDEAEREILRILGR